MTTRERRGWRRRGRRRRERIVETPAPPSQPVKDLSFKVGQRVRFYPSFRPAGGGRQIGTVIRTGDTVDVRWADGRVSHMLQPVLLQPVTDETPAEEYEEFSAQNYRP